MTAQLIVALIMISPYGCIFDGAVHPFNLPVGPWMVGLGQSMFDAVRLTNHIESHLAGGGGAAIAGLFSELKSVVRQDCMDLVRNNLKKMFQKPPRRLTTGRFHQPRHRKFAGSVNSAVLVYMDTSDQNSLSIPEI